MHKDEKGMRRCHKLRVQGWKEWTENTMEKKGQEFETFEVCVTKKRNQPQKERGVGQKILLRCSDQKVIPHTKASEIAGSSQEFQFHIDPLPCSPK